VIDLAWFEFISLFGNFETGNLLQKCRSIPGLRISRECLIPFKMGINYGLQFVIVNHLPAMKNKIEMMRKFGVLLILVFVGQMTMAQLIYNPNIAIKPIPTLSVYKLEMTENTTSVTFRIVNSTQLPPFSIKSKDIILRKVSDTKDLPLVSSENVKFWPEKHVFSFKDEIYEFTLVFGGLVQPVKYLDIIEQTPGKEFYVQGIVVDTDLNNEISRGFRAYQLGDVMGALENFINVAEMDLYFEYGLAYFNILYILSQQNRWEEAQEWYSKFKNRFFYDKQLLSNELQRMGIIQRLEEGR